MTVLPDMTLSRTTMATLTEHAVAAQLYADEFDRTHPDSSIGYLARGEAIGWRHALILMGGTMPERDGATSGCTGGEHSYRWEKTQYVCRECGDTAALNDPRWD